MENTLINYRIKETAECLCLFAESFRLHKHTLSLYDAKVLSYLHSYTRHILHERTMSRPDRLIIPYMSISIRGGNIWDCMDKKEKQELKGKQLLKRDKEAPQYITRYMAKFIISHADMPFEKIPCVINHLDHKDKKAPKGGIEAFSHHWGKCMLLAKKHHYKMDDEDRKRFKQAKALIEECLRLPKRLISNWEVRFFAGQMEELEKFILTNKKLGYRVLLKYQRTLKSLLNLFTLFEQYQTRNLCMDRDYILCLKNLMRKQIRTVWHEEKANANLQFSIEGKKDIKVLENIVHPFNKWFTNGYIFDDEALNIIREINRKAQYVIYLIELDKKEKHKLNLRKRKKSLASKSPNPYDSYTKVAGQGNVAKSNEIEKQFTELFGGEKLGSDEIIRIVKRIVKTGNTFLTNNEKHKQYMELQTN